jgi:hypothetical protein
MPLHTTADDFAAWVARSVPDGTWVFVDVIRTYKRDGGTAWATFDVSVVLERHGLQVDRSSDDLVELAAWVTHVAIPHLQTGCARNTRDLRGRKFRQLDSPALQSPVKSLAADD